MPRKLNGFLDATQSLVPSYQTLQLVLLTVAASAVAYARTAISPLQESIRVALSLSDNEMALLQGPALALPVLIFSAPLGMLVDRLVRVRLLFIFAIADAVASAVTAVSYSFGVLFLARSIVGLTATGTSITALSLIADLFPPAKRGRANMVLTVGQFGGFSAAFMLGGILLSGPTANDWRSAMVLLSMPLLVAIISILGLREPPRSGLRIRNYPARAAFWKIWSYRSVVAPLLGGVVAAEIAILAVLTWAVPTFLRVFSFSPDRIGALMAVVVLVTGLLGAIAGGMSADICQRRGGPRHTFLFLSTVSLIGAPAGLFAVVPKLEWTAPLLILFMIVSNTILTAGMTLFTVVIPNEVRGLSLSVSAAAATFFGLGLGPMIVSALSSAMGGQVMIGKALAFVCVTTCLFASVIYAVGARALRRSAY